MILVQLTIFWDEILKQPATDQIHHDFSALITELEQAPMETQPADESADVENEEEMGGEEIGDGASTPPEEEGMKPSKAIAAVAENLAGKAEQSLKEKLSAEYARLTTEARKINNDRQRLLNQTKRFLSIALVSLILYLLTLVPQLLLWKPEP